MKDIQTVSSDGVLRKNKNMLRNHFYCYLMYTLLFNIISVIVEVAIIAEQQELYPFIIEILAAMKTKCYCLNSLNVEPPASKDFTYRNT